MSAEKEELLADPVNHAMMKTLAKEEKLSLRELSQRTGVREERVRKIVGKLQEYDFVGRKAGDAVMEEDHLERLGDFRSEIEGFSEDHSGNISEVSERQEEELEALREELEKEKEETDLVTREKEIGKKLELVEKALQDESSDLEGLVRKSRLNRILGRGDGFREFQPFRKKKVMEKIDEVLDEAGDEQRRRRFFGNRWATGKS